MDSETKVGISIAVIVIGGICFLIPFAMWGCPQYDGAVTVTLIGMIESV